MYVFRWVNFFISPFLAPQSTKEQISIYIYFLLQQMTQAQEEEDAEDEEMGVAETYAEYWPAKCEW